jgi:hypothetical protein
MPIFSFDSFGRDSLIACDTCDAVMGPGGARTTHSHRTSEPELLAHFYGNADELRRAGKQSGWRENGEQWFCPQCRNRSIPPRKAE